ncbi:MAG: hypothetical protein ACJAWV_003870 [Flammeovirgaceae bacterium]|jgi:hypothetical protein
MTPTKDSSTQTNVSRKTDCKLFLATSYVILQNIYSFAQQIEFGGFETIDHIYLYWIKNNTLV